MICCCYVYAYFSCHSHLIIIAKQHLNSKFFLGTTNTIVLNLYICTAQPQREIDRCRLICKKTDLVCQSSVVLRRAHQAVSQVSSRVVREKKRPGPARLQLSQQRDWLEQWNVDTFTFSSPHNPVNWTEAGETIPRASKWRGAASAGIIWPIATRFIFVRNILLEVWLFPVVWLLLVAILCKERK